MRSSVETSKFALIAYFVPGFRLGETAGFAAAGSSVFALADRASFSGAPVRPPWL